VNFLAHVVVAARCGNQSPEAALGAALPDLAKMAGVRYDRDVLPADVRWGVDCHHRADARFHADRRFLDGAALLRRLAAERGVPPGPAPAVGHAGWELLLDGAVAAEAAEPFLGAVAVATSVPVDRPDDWRRLVGTLGDRWWLRYDDPAFVADRLVGMTARRPRLALDPAHRPAVVDVLAEVQPAVYAVAQDVSQWVVSSTRPSAVQASP